MHGGSGVDHGGLKSASGMAYMAFSFMWLFVYHKVSQKDFSAIVTCGAVPPLPAATWRAAEWKAARDTALDCLALQRERRTF